MELCKLSTSSFGTPSALGFYFFNMEQLVYYVQKGYVILSNVTTQAVHESYHSKISL